MIQPANRISVLDDQPQTLEVMRDVLEPEGYAVSCTTRIGPELHEIRDAQPDLVVVDMLLATDQRALSGWDVVRLVRSHADLYRVPILMVSADHALLRSVAGEARRMRGVHLLTKPFSVDELLAAVRRALDRSESAAMPGEPGRRQEAETTRAAAYD